MAPERKDYRAAQVKRGFHVVYRPGETNYCPGCGRTHWLIGNVSVECAFCATALDLPNARSGAGVLRR